MPACLCCNLITAIGTSLFCGFVRADCCAMLCLRYILQYKAFRSASLRYARSQGRIEKKRKRSGQRRPQFTCKLGTCKCQLHAARYQPGRRVHVLSTYLVERKDKEQCLTSEFETKGKSFAHHTSNAVRVFVYFMLDDICWLSPTLSASLRCRILIGTHLTALCGLIALCCAVLTVLQYSRCSA